MENTNTNTNTENTTVKAKTTLFGKFKDLAGSPRTKRTLAAAVGVGAGLAVTAASSRSNKASIAVTTVFGAMEIASVNRNELLEDSYDDSASTLAIIAGVKAVETSIIGLVLNRTVGSKPSQDPASAETSNSAEPQEIEAKEPEEPSKPTLFEKAMSVIKPKQPEPEAVVEQTPEAQPVTG